MLGFDKPTMQAEFSIARSLVLYVEMIAEALNNFLPILLHTTDSFFNYANLIYFHALRVLCSIIRVRAFGRV